MRYFDAHAHVQFDLYDADREDLLAKMREEEVGGLMVGVDLESSRRAIALVEGRDDLYASVGLHPNHADEFEGAEVYAELAKHPKVVAIGECGLDNFRPADADASAPRQREVFAKHVELALASDKPLMIHARPRKGTMDAYDELIDILGSYRREHGDTLRGNIHFFVGGVEEAKALIELGFTISFTAVLTFACDYDEVVRHAPLSSILAETDAPYVAPASRRGERNDPLAVKDVVRAIAEIRGEDEEAVRTALLANARRLFAL
ncbi:MAG TPA: TatD family hydrolase [Candidatus Paceibacterota bacterium]|nr:TatD family hydrolase [Candidatus Paceibacterota bacterium]